MAGPPAPFEGSLAQLRSGLPRVERIPGSLRTLAAYLDALFAAPGLGARRAAFASVATWARGRERDLPLPEGAPLGPGENNPRLRRTAFLIRALEASPALRDGVRGAVRELIAETESAATLARTGDDDGRSFAGELVHRAVSRVLPLPSENHDAGALLARVLPDAESLAALRDLPPAWFARLAAALAPGNAPAPWAALRSEAATALSILAARVAAGGLSPRLWRLAPTAALQHSPFLRLSRDAEALIADPAAQPALAETLRDCRAEADAIRERLEATGITVAIVRSLEAVRRGLDRIESLSATLAAPPESGAGAAQRLMVEVVEALHEERSVSGLVVHDLRLLARRIVERHGTTGEHYIARNRAEYAGMWRAAVGGGLLTVLTAGLKLRIGMLGLAALPEGLLAGLNYAASFLVMLALHLALATKQPSMTGATLAAIVRSTGGRQRLDRLADHVADTVRTQLAAALGNVLAVSAGTVALDLVLRGVTGATLIDGHKAAHVLHDLHPLASGTAFYAAITGVILWLSGLVGGWFENWSVVHRLPEAIAQHPLGDRLGRARLQRWGRSFGDHAAAWGGSVALGMLLGIAPAIGRFAGVPLDVRHVTLSTGTLGFAASALAPGHLAAADLLWAAAGIAVIFALNLSVSFVLALALALRAQGVPDVETLRLGRKLLGRFLRRPWQFVGPPAR